MRSWMTLSLNLVASLLASSLATSAAMLSTDALSDGRSTACIEGAAHSQPKYPESIQIFMRKQDEQYWYIIWQGPSGIAVLPCNDERFKVVGKMGPYLYGIIDPIFKPPFPPPGYVNIPYRGKPNECYYSSTGVDAGLFHCGQYMIINCRKDPLYGDPVFQCADGEYHRGFICEY